MARKPITWKCPDGRAHHWIIDGLNHGVCINPGCKAERDFPWVPEFGRMVEVGKESASKGGRKGGLISRRVPPLTLWT